MTYAALVLLGRIERPDEVFRTLLSTRPSFICEQFATGKSVPQSWSNLAGILQPHARLSQSGALRRIA
jgi:hypothetical protein